MITELPMLREGKRGSYMIGNFIHKDQIMQFKIWEEEIFQEVRTHGRGIYDATVVGSEYGRVYLTVKAITHCEDPAVNASYFLPSLDPKVNTEIYQRAKTTLLSIGADPGTFVLAEKILTWPSFEGRFFIEGAAMRHHDNIIGGLAHHSYKMLDILATVLTNTPALRPSSDLLILGVLLHDIGKIFEYNNLGPGDYWFANHRVRGIEVLTQFKDDIISFRDEYFYRQLQAIIMGHHGDYGDRPTTVATAIVHYIDTLESQVTGFVEDMVYGPEGERVKGGDWGYLEPLAVDRQDKITPSDIG